MEYLYGMETERILMSTGNEDWYSDESSDCDAWDDIPVCGKDPWQTVKDGQIISGKCKTPDTRLGDESCWRCGGRIE